jgi:hypothetical protein
MSDLWIYFRRPSCMTRYRHGGAAAFDPAMRSPLAGEAIHTGTGTVLQPAPREEVKILHFPTAKPGGRKKQADKQRGGARPKAAGPGGPKKPKRD